MSSATSKSALVTARQLRRLGDHRLVGLTSPKNTSYLRDIALYHQVLSYEDAASLATDGTTTYVDFLGRESLTAKVHEVLGERLIRSVMFGATDWTDKPGGVQPPKGSVRGPTPEFFFTPSYREARLVEEPALSTAIQRDMRDFIQLAQVRYHSQYAWCRQDHLVLDEASFGGRQSERRLGTAILTGVVRLPRHRIARDGRPAFLPSFQLETSPIGGYCCKSPKIEQAKKSRQS